MRKIGLALAVVVCAGAVALPASAEPDPVDTAARSLASGTLSAVGGNDWNCRSEHDPVVVVHGSAGNAGLANETPPVPAQLAYVTLTPLLRAKGYCIFGADLNNAESLYHREPAYDDPQKLVDTIGEERAPTQLDVFVTGVLRATGAKRVDLLGHSLGAPVARSYLLGDGNAATVDDLISLGGSNLHLDDVWPESPDIVGENPVPSVREIFGADGGAFLAWLNGPDNDRETLPGVDYTALGLNNEALIARPFLAPASGDVTNFFVGPKTVHLDDSRMPAPNCIVLPPSCDKFDVFAERAYLSSDEYAVRQVCPGALIDDGGLLRHSLWAANPQAQRVILRALDADGPAPADFDPCALSR